MLVHGKSADLPFQHTAYALRRLLSATYYRVAWLPAGELPMRCTLFVMLSLAISTAWTPEPARGQSSPDKDSAKPDYKPLNPESPALAGPFGNLDVTSRRFGILKATDPKRQRITLVLDGETEIREWPVRPGAEVWCFGLWGRLDQFTVGDRVWVWFEKNAQKQPLAVSLLADELSEQDLYAPVKIKAISRSGPAPSTLTLETVRDGKPTTRTVKLTNVSVFRGDTKAPLDSLKVGEQVHVQTTGDDARLILDPVAFEKRRSAQKVALRKRWADEGLPGTLVFKHNERHEIELMLDHEAMHWGRSLRVGDKVTLQANKVLPAVVRQLRPWRERTQVLLRMEGQDEPSLAQGQRVSLRARRGSPDPAVPPAADDDRLPVGTDPSRGKQDRIEWLVSSVYCPCMMHDACAGHFFTLAACNAGPNHSCGMATSIRARIAEMIDKGQTDRQIVEELFKQHGPKLLRPHMSP